MRLWQKLMRRFRSPEPPVTLIKIRDLGTISMENAQRLFRHMEDGDIFRIELTRRGNAIDMAIARGYEEDEEGGEEVVARV